MANEKDSIVLEDEQVYDQTLLDNLLLNNHIDEFSRIFFIFFNKTINSIIQFNNFSSFLYFS